MIHFSIYHQNDVKQFLGQRAAATHEKKREFFYSTPEKSAAPAPVPVFQPEPEEVKPEELVFGGSVEEVIEEVEVGRDLLFEEDPLLGLLGSFLFHYSLSFSDFHQTNECTLLHTMSHLDSRISFRSDFRFLVLGMGHDLFGIFS